MLDIHTLIKPSQPLQEMAAGSSIADLHRLTDQMIDTILAHIANAKDEDVTFEPQDPEAFDRFTDIPDEVNMAWTLGHVIVHTTASSEESAALALTLARGLPVAGRSRYEVTWREMHRVEQLHQRMAESRRMRHAMLDAWPDRPHLENSYTPNYPKARPLNPVSRFLIGLLHEASHLGQIEDIMQQASNARNKPAAENDSDLGG